MIEEPTQLQKMMAEDLYLLGGQFAILCQFSHPDLAKGSYIHSRFATRIVTRLRNTTRFLNAAVYGSPEEKRAIFSIIHRYHSRVKGDGYDANDPELHKWTAATSFVGLVVIHETFIGKLAPQDMEALYHQSAVFGTSLQMTPEMWPATLEEFWKYWHHNLATLPVTDEARKLSRDLLYPINLPLWMQPLAPIARLLTVHLLPERLAQEYNLQRTAWSWLQFRVVVWIMQVTYLQLSRWFRQLMHRYYMDDLKRAVTKSQVSPI